MTLTTLDHADLADAVSALHRVSDDLDRRRELTERQVDDLLDGGWRGAAAASYREGWEEWRVGCAEVLAALRTMTRLIVAAGTDLDAADDRARDAMSALTARLAERLG